MLKRSATLISLTLALLAAAHAQPTITSTGTPGVHAFWYLGVLPAGVYSDGGTCSGQSGPCYYTELSLTASPSSGSNYAWTVGTTGAGSVTLMCPGGNCSNTSDTITVIATSASTGCADDVYIYASYNGGPLSAGYGLTIVTPSPTTTSLASGYPIDGQETVWNGTMYVPIAGSFETTYNWELRDSCSNGDSGIDQTEAFCTSATCSYSNENNNAVWTEDYVGNNWGTPVAQSGYVTGYVFADYMGQPDEPSWTQATQSPPTNGYETCSTTTPIMHVHWEGYVGSTLTDSSSCTGTGVAACGAQVLSNSFQYYQDCGRHN